MPKLRPETRAARRQHILDAARGCFIERGFAATTIQHICTAADVSAGAIYTWFASKHAIVEALADAAFHTGTQLSANLSDAHADPDATVDALADRACGLFASRQARTDAQLDLQLWAAALGDDALRQGCRASIDAVANAMASVAQQAQRAHRLTPTLDPAAVGALLTAITLGLEVQSALGMPGAEALGQAVKQLLNGEWSGRDLGGC